MNQKDPYSPSWLVVVSTVVVVGVVAYAAFVYLAGPLLLRQSITP